MTHRLWPAIRAAAAGFNGRQSKSAQHSEDTKIHNEVRSAWREYEAAHAYFNIVTEPDLVDHAVYRLEAARKRYVYFLKKAKEDRPLEER